MGSKVYGSYYKGHKDKIKGRVEVGDGGGTGWGGVEGLEKMQTILTE